MTTLLIGAGGCDFQVGSRSTSTETDIVWFQDDTHAAGLSSYMHDSGHRDRHYFPECVSGGVALIDVDNDGWLDVYFIQSGHIGDPVERRPPNRLYRNNRNGTFTDITENSGTGDRGYGMGVATGDFDNDGFTDIYITNLGPNVLLRNNGDGTFTDVTEVAGVGDANFGASAAFLDFDGDGHLDLFVVNYVHWSIGTELFCTSATGQEEYCSPLAYHAPTADVLYRNNGDGTFTNISRHAGIDRLAGNGLGVVCGDFNGDGLIDIYVANDGTRNRLWINLGDGRFEDQAMEFGVAIDDDGTEKAGMGVVAIDIDDDGDLDLLVVNMFLQTCSFHRNEGHYFLDITGASGLGATGRRFTRFGVGMVDFDNDGRLDLYLANGDIVVRPPQWADDPYAEPNLLWRGISGDRFEEVQPRGGTSKPLIATGRAAAFGDLNNDGAIDVLVINRDGPPHLLKNVVGRQGNWIMLRVIDEHGRDALGASVELRVGERTIHRDVRTAYSYLAANDPRVHAGLGARTEVDEILVRWVDGTQQSFGAHPANRIITLRRNVE